MCSRGSSEPTPVGRFAELGMPRGWSFLLIPLFWIGLFFLIAAFAGRRWRRGGWANGGAPWAHGARSAESTLAERFAQGDIEEQEYRARLEVLRVNTGPERPSR